MSPKKKKIVIMTVPFGGGHLTMARIIAEALEAEGGDSVEVKVLNVFDDWLPGSPKFFSKSYENSVKSTKSVWYKLFFNFTDARPAAMNRFCNLIFQPLGLRLFERERPDLLISTFSILSYVAHRTLVKQKADIPLVSIITDAGEVHKLWLMGVEDAVITATEDTIDYAVSHGVPSEALHYYGFPVLKKFADAPSKKEARKKLKLLASAPTALLTNGGLGMNPKKMLSIAKRIAKGGFPYQIMFVCGHNRELREAISALDFKDAKVRVFGFVEDMPDLMAASDIICTKAGWLSLSEALEVKRPIFLFDYIHGHEKPNAEYIVKSGYGELETDIPAFTGRLKVLLANPELLKPYEIALESRPSGSTATRKIARFMLGYLKKR